MPFAIICCAMLLNKLGVFREAIEPLFHSSKAGDRCRLMTPGNSISPCRSSILYAARLWLLSIFVVVVVSDLSFCSPLSLLVRVFTFLIVSFRIFPFRFFISLLFSDFLYSVNRKYHD